MLLNITVNAENANDLGYLLGKHPDRWQRKELSFGEAHVFYPEVQEKRCTASLLIDIDSTRETRNKRLDHFGRNANVQAGFADYVTDRAYVASSLLATAIAKVYGSALNGNCHQKPALIQQLWPLELELAAVCVRGSADLLQGLFEPLGYTVKAKRVALDDNFPGWGGSPYYHLTLSGQKTVQEALQHLYVLLPILDNRKHYYVKESEVEKLLAKAENWLGNHPLKALITRRYFNNRRSLEQSALHELKSVDNTNRPPLPIKESIANKTSLHQRRHDAVIRELLLAGAHAVLDLGCSTGKLLQRLVDQPQFTTITGADVSLQALKQAGRRIGLPRDTWQVRNGKASLMQAALTYKDERFRFYDAAVLVEVIEHLDSDRLPALAEVVFGYAKPKTVIITTPNVEYNVLFDNLPNGKLRHTDHRFEWDRATFHNWAEKIGKQYDYTFAIQGVGEVHHDYGSPSQMAIFQKVVAAAKKAPQKKK